MTATWSGRLAAWSSAVAFDDLPDDVVASTLLRIVDVVGLSLVGRSTSLGASIGSAAARLYGEGPSTVLGDAIGRTPAGAAFANAASAQALEFDDTHNRSVVHLSSPSVAVALALAEADGHSGHEVVRAVAVGNEISARLGSAAPQQFHRRGFHPTAMFTPFGAAAVAAALAGLTESETAAALGLAGSRAAGLLQCWVDGTDAKFLHSGWAAEAGIAVAALAGAGVSGPAEVFEGRWGLFAAHLQDEGLPLDTGRVLDRLGEHWESRESSFKPFPVAHVIHPYIDALLRVRATGIPAERIVAVECPIAPYQEGIVAIPRAEKLDPLSPAHARVSLPYTLAEAYLTGRIDRTSFADAPAPAVVALAARIHHVVDESYPGPERYAGAVRVTLDDGTVLEELEPINRGAPGNPMSPDDIAAKFRDNATAVLEAGVVEELLAGLRGLLDAPDVGAVLRLGRSA